MTEVWRKLDVPGPEHYITKEGKVQQRKIKAAGQYVDCLLTRKPTITPTGAYLSFRSDNGAQTNIYLQYLVARTWLPNPEGHDYILAKDGNPHNYSLGNLTWTDRRPSYKGNGGRRRRGCKLQEVDAETIRKRAKTESQADLAREYEVDPSTISLIVGGKRWIS